MYVQIPIARKILSPDSDLSLHEPSYLLGCIRRVGDLSPVCQSRWEL